MKLTESSLIGNIVQEAKGLSMILDVTMLIESIQACISGTVDFLSQVKSKKERTSLVYEDLKGNMVAAATVEFIEGEDDNPGNWALSFTFDKKDIEGNKTYSIFGSGPKQVIGKRSFDDFRLAYATPEALSQVDSLFFSLLYDLLDQNAVDGEKFTIEHDGYFVASVEVINGEKIMTFIPDGAIKRLIKDDSSASETENK